MVNNLSITTMRLIRSLLATKTDEQIAEMIGCPQEQVTGYISQLTGIVTRPKRTLVPKPKKPPVDKKVCREIKVAQRIAREEKKLEREKEKRREIKKVYRDKKIVQEERDRLKARQQREEARTVKGRSLEQKMQGKVMVKLNSKTHVWVAPGTDIELLKKKLRIS